MLAITPTIAAFKRFLGSVVTLVGPTLDDVGLQTGERKIIWRGNAPESFRPGEQSTAGKWKANLRPNISVSVPCASPRWTRNQRQLVQARWSSDISSSVLMAYRTITDHVRLEDTTVDFRTVLSVTPTFHGHITSKDRFRTMTIVSTLSLLYPSYQWKG